MVYTELLFPLFGVDQRFIERARAVAERGRPGKSQDVS